MADQRSRRESLNFRDIFNRRRTSLDDVCSNDNSRRNSMLSTDSFKNLTCLMGLARMGAGQADCLPSPLLKKPWLDPSGRQPMDIELASLNGDNDYFYPPKHSQNTWYSNEGLDFESHNFDKNNGFSSKVLFEDTHGLGNGAPLTKPDKKPPTTNKSIISFSFNLESDARKSLHDSNDFTELEKRRLLIVMNYKIKQPASEVNRLGAIRRYLDKKKRRKFVSQVKYRVRQELACQRVRVKGKFVKSSKRNLVSAASILLEGILKRKP